MASKRLTPLGQIDIQFGREFDWIKANQLVQEIQHTESVVNQLITEVASLTAEAGGGTVAPHVLATIEGLGAEHTVSGLTAGTVLIAVAGDNAAFGRLSFGELARVDPATFDEPVEGDIISFHNGYWSAIPNDGGLGIGNPGADALLMWDQDRLIPGFAWALGGVGISITPGSIAVVTSDLDHGELQGLLDDDHPQYALIASPETITAPWIFAQGLRSDADITLVGNVEQSGEEPEWRIQNTDDGPDEGTWRVHVEPGMLNFASVADDGSDGENWLVVTRAEELVENVNVSAHYFTFNGSELVTVDSLPPPVFIPPPPLIRVATFVNPAILSVPINDVFLDIPTGGTLTAVRLLTQGGPGNCVVDLWKAAYGSFPPVLANSITAAALPSITAGVKYEDLVLPGWTTAVTAGDVIAVHLDSVLDFTVVSLQLEIQPT